MCFRSLDAGPRVGLIAFLLLSSQACSIHRPEVSWHKTDLIAGTSGRQAPSGAGSQGRAAQKTIVDDPVPDDWAEAHPRDVISPPHRSAHEGATRPVIIASRYHERDVGETVARVTMDMAPGYSAESLPVVVLVGDRPGDAGELTLGVRRIFSPRRWGKTPGGSQSSFLFDTEIDPLRATGTETLSQSVETSGTFRLQLFSFRQRSEADEAVARLKKAFGEILGDKPLVVEDAVLDNGVVFHRVRAGPYGSVAEAISVCVSLRGRGQECLVVSAVP